MSADAAIGATNITLDCDGPPANPAGQLRFTSCQVTTSNGNPAVSCARDPDEQGVGTIELVLLDSGFIQVGTPVVLDSTALSVSGAFTTSAITASSVDGSATGSITFSTLELAAPRRVDGAFSGDAAMRFRPDPSYSCAVRGGFEAIDLAGM